MDDSSMTSDLFTEKMELNVTEHFEGQEALDWLKEKHPEIYDNISGTFEDGRCFQNDDYWRDKLVCEKKKMEVWKSTWMILPQKTLELQ